ncbi:methyltransferase domain-containing protein [Spirochaeta thermophila]|uniref:THUMP domain-containing protein n=1 Tax=Winmispira thermophila (strain ATCC 49972 / DSM 6192 / RI 19.B1) TaxID=665571 RepID=E0RRC3_WINT6|nr:methyltransferase domain-containing protein [Spirochaeta thermophila]ADN03100.1 hypothetical protein STHERM_c21710 [Spirochaeta thermophila DSM 6192]
MFILTTHPGLEDIVEAELTRTLTARGLPAGKRIRKPFGLKGNVLYHHPDPEDHAIPVLSSLHSIYHIKRYHTHLEVPEGRDILGFIQEALTTLSFPHLEEASSFRILSERVGDHPFTHMDIERAAGEILHTTYRCPVNLTSPEVTICVDLYDRHVLVGELLSRPRFYTRYEKPYHPRVSLKPPLAYGLLHLSGIFNDPGPLLDPFCGAGTILLEAADLLPEGLPICGLDISWRAFSGTARNLEAEGFERKVRLVLGDARRLSSYFPPESFQYIVTDPPFGVKLGRRLDFEDLFSAFLEEASLVLKPGGTMVFLTMHWRIISRLLGDREDLVVIHRRRVEESTLRPHMVVLRKT